MDTGVLEGRDGWLFLIGGSNVVGSLYHRRSALLDDAKLRRWAELIEVRARRCERMGIQYVHINIPEKLTIYDNKLHDPPLVDWTLSPAMRLREMVGRSRYAHVWLDLIDLFRADRDRKQLYHKTDSHWSAEGCFLAYTLLCRKIGIEPISTLLSRSSTDVHGFSDLGSKMEPPVSEHIRVFDYSRDSIRTYTNAIAKDLESAEPEARVHIGSHVSYRNHAPAAAKKKILIFGDSYSNIHRDVLTGMLAASAREVEFVWSSSLDWAYIRRAKPDVVVYELVERFMTVLVHDDLSLRWSSVRQGCRGYWLRFRALWNRPGM